MSAGTSGRGIIRTAAAVAAIGGLALLIAYMAGSIGHRKVAPGTVPLPAPAAPPAGAQARVERREVEDFLEWPGTVRSRTVAGVAPRVLARILAVKVVAGASVKAGDPIALLDDAEIRARVAQARSAVAGAEAADHQAEADRVRVRGLFERRAATETDLEQAETRTKTARAELERARHALAEAESVLAETIVRAPFDGTVLERLAEPGDMAVPGKPVATVHDPGRLRLEAVVPEQCAAKATVGMEVAAAIDSLGRELRATVEEIAPAADPRTRTFVLKAALPADPALRPGAFGRFRQPCGKRAVLLVPAAAVSRTGQLETAHVLEGGVARPRHVRTGKRHGDALEVLAGLSEGEVVLLEGTRP